jgi:hypothetical protein
MAVAAHAYIEVTDAALGIAFYCDGMGLRVKRRLSPRWIELTGAGIPIFLLASRPEIADLGSVTARRSYERHWSRFTWILSSAIWTRWFRPCLHWEGRSIGPQGEGIWKDRKHG